MDREEEMGFEELMGRIGRLTQALLEDGAEPSQVAFALTSVATDMGLQLTGDPLKVFPVLLNAIAHQASQRAEDEGARPDAEEAGAPPGATVH